MSASPPSEMHMKAAVSSYVVCVVRNMEFSAHYFSVKHVIIDAPTVYTTRRVPLYSCPHCFTLADPPLGCRADIQTLACCSARQRATI
jgi:hypothetical protein